jgi:hypothetical protein
MGFNKMLGICGLAEKPLASQFICIHNTVKFSFKFLLESNEFEVGKILNEGFNTGCEIICLG